MENWQADHKYKAHSENTYDHYYELCRELYFTDNPDHQSFNNDVRKIGIDTKNLFSNDNKFFVNSEYQSVISQVAKSCGKAITFFGRERKELPQRSLDGHLLHNISANHGNLLNEKMEELLAMIMPTVEREYVGAYCRPWYVSASRTLLLSDISADSVRHDCGTAFQWHSDQTMSQSFKLFFYLTDVDEGSAPFTYLVDPDGNPVNLEGEDWIYIARSEEEHKKLNTGRSKQSRIPIEEINMLKSKGYKEREVYMPAGSFMVFRPNYYHKATIAKKRVRDVLQVQLRPVLKKPETYWLGSEAQTHNHQFKTQHQHDWWAYN